MFFYWHINIVALIDINMSFLFDETNTHILLEIHNRIIIYKGGEDVDVRSMQDFNHEIMAMHKLQHKYLLPLYGVVMTTPIKLN